jgi:hypothetical protein
MPAVPAKKLTGVQRFDHPVREVPSGAFAGTECLYNAIDHFCANKGIPLDREGRPSPLRDPVTLCLGTVLTGSGPLCGSPSHIDHPDLPPLPPLISGNDSVHRLLRGQPLLQQVE